MAMKTLCCMFAVLMMPFASAADDGLIEAYDNLALANPAQSHMKRAKVLNRLIPRIVDDLDIEHPSIGFYIAPGNENRLEVTNDGEGAMVARFACYSARGRKPGDLRLAGGHD